MEAMSRMRLALAPAALLLAQAGTAAADRMTCPLAEAGTIDVDGMLDDWQGAPRRAGGPDPDASFDLRCQYDGQRLQLSIDVRDDRLVRNAQARGKLEAGEDRLEITLSAGGAPLTVTLFPGYLKAPPRRRLGAAALPRWLAVEDTLQKKGWSAELDLPLARVAGWTPATPSLAAHVVYHDSDAFAAGGAESTVEAIVDLDLGDKKDLLRSFLAATRVARKDVVVDVQADVDPTRPGPERVVAGGGFIGVLAEQFGYVQLQARPADVGKIEVADLRGDGSRVILAQIRQRGSGGSRDLLLGFTAHGGQLAPLFTIEIGKEQDGHRLASRWVLQPRGKGRKRPELVVESQPAVGWDEDSYAEAPAPDAEPIHLPWDEDRWGGVYWLEGDAVRSRPLSGKRKGR